jgi:hypothetical protein
MIGGPNFNRQAAPRFIFYNQTEKEAKSGEFREC